MSTLRRLKKDYQELLQDVDRWSIAPIDDSFMTWHGNLVANYGRFQGLILHYEILFTENYPHLPPRVSILTTLNHSNVRIGWNGRRGDICLDLLGTGGYHPKGSVPFSGWSSSYTVKTILMQMETFLFEDEIEYLDGSCVNTFYFNANESNFLTPTIEMYINQAFDSAKNYVCSKCSHTFDKPFPELICQVPERRIYQLPFSNHPSQDMTKYWEWIDNFSEEEIDKALEYFKFANFEEGKRIDTQRVKFYFNDIENNIRTSHTSDVGKKLAEVMLKMSSKMYQELTNVLEPIGLGKCHCSCSLELISCLESHGCPNCQNNFDQIKKSFLINSNVRKLLVKYQFEHPILQEWNQIYNESTQGSLEVPIDNPKELIKYTIQKTQSMGSYRDTIFLIVSMGYLEDLKPKILPNNIQLDELVQEESPINSEMIKQLETLPRELFIDIADKLTYKERTQLGHHSEILAESFKSPYFWERKELICYFNRKSYLETPLGIPISVTFFRDSETIKSMGTPMDLLSQEAFDDQQVRKSVWNQDFQVWIPLYLTEGHYNRNKGELIRRITKLYTDRRIEISENTSFEEILLAKVAIEEATPLNPTKPKPFFSYKRMLENYRKRKEKENIFKPVWALELFSTLLSSIVVEMMKGDLYISIKALETYCLVHRLFYQMSLDYPEIREIAEERIQIFKSDRKNRHKRKIENLAKFLTYFSITEKYSWKDIKDYYLEEGLKRNIYWILLANPDFHKAKNGFFFQNPKRLQASFDAVAVGKRLLVFNLYFLNKIARPPGKSLKDVARIHDYYYGKPDPDIRSKFQEDIQKIYQIKSWKDFYREIRVSYRGDGFIGNQLFWAYNDSNACGYNAKFFNNLKAQKEKIKEESEAIKLLELHT